MPAANAKDLWPEDLISEPDDKSPTSILREQAELLGQKTNHTVLASVETSGDDESGQFAVRFVLVAPKIDDYRYILFRIREAPDGYPVKIKWDNNTYVADNESGFRQYVQNILSSHQTKKIVSKLYHESSRRWTDSI